MKDRRLAPKEIWKRALLGILTISAFSALVMLLWNWLIPEIFGLTVISYWQALGLFALTRILFGHFGGGKPGDAPTRNFKRENHIRTRWMNMSEEERKKFVDRRKDFFREGPFQREDFWERMNKREAGNEANEGE